MRLLYLSCHSILEYDEIRLFLELGLEVFSHGAYTNPKMPGDPKRPGIDAPFYPNLYNMAVAYGKENLHPDMIAWSDVIVVSHIVDWINLNWGKMRGKRVIWRSIGQSTLNIENLVRPLRAQGLEIVRYSPRERTIPGYAGEDAVIRFYKDPDEFGPWEGTEKKVITFGQSFKKRKDFCNWEVWEEVTKNLPRMAYGPENEDLGEINGGCPDYRALQAILRKNRVYFYTGTYPASYTLNFMEAWMTGIPLVAVGRQLGDSPFELGQNTYEVPDLLDETGGGLYSDSLTELTNYITMLMEDDRMAKELSEKGRAGALKFFNKEDIKKQWGEFLNV